MSLISGNENKIFARGEIGIERKAQEDSHGLRLGTPNGDLFVVCDGMGGHVAGEVASRMLVDSTHSVAEIAFSCGFNNLSNFNRIFKKRKGCSPTEFRDNYHKTRIII